MLIQELTHKKVRNGGRVLEKLQTFNYTPIQGISEEEKRSINHGSGCGEELRILYEGDF